MERGRIKTVASTDSVVLICGETGAGKELIARAIHNLGARRERTLVKLNCAAISTGLLESELFGHEKGAFTEAITQCIERFELAHKGRLLLDDVGDIFRWNCSQTGHARRWRSAGRGNQWLASNR